MKERHLQIINLVNEKEKVSVQELSELLKLSMVTIRKDLEELESQGLLRRQHGYATKASPDAINSRMAFHTPIWYEPLPPPPSNTKPTLYFFPQFFIFPNINKRFVPLIHSVFSMIIVLIIRQL